jgi:predicted Zn-dependent peptidase
MLEKREYGRIGERVWRDTLENGLRLTIIKKPDYSKSMAFFATNYGGSDRKFKVNGQWHDTPAGIAHYLEHKMFDVEGAENALTTLSGRGASANAFTSSDMTAYHFESIDLFYENLETLLKFVSIPYFTEESVNKERGIIAQEIGMVEDDPDYAVYYGLLRSLFKKNPVRDAVAGTVESIGEITPETLYSCHKLFYTPSNMTLVVVGNQDPERVRDMAEEILPKGPSATPERDYGGKEGMKPHTQSRETTMEVAAPIFLAGAKTKPELHGSDGARFELIADIAMSTLMGTASPLYNRMYADGMINETFGYDFEVTSGVSFLSFGGESKCPEKVFETVMEEAQRLVSQGIPEKFFLRRKKSTMGGEIRALNSFDNLCYNTAVADFYGYDYFELPYVFDSIEANDVSEFIRDYFIPENMAVSIVKN